MRAPALDIPRWRVQSRLLSLSTTRRRLVMGTAVFAATLAVGGGSLIRNRQLGYMRGLSDRWLALALNLGAHRVFGNASEPTLFKPPGYPFFLWAVLAPTAGRPTPSATPARFPNASDLAGLDLPYEASYVERAARTVYWSHAIVLALSASLLFFWFADCFRESVALSAGLLYGINPYSVILAGTLHYSVVHLFTLIAACALLHAALRSRPPRTPMLVAAGAAFGVATLVRPLTLLLPPFVFLALLLRSRRSWAPSLRGAGLFTAGMILVIAPWTARNFVVSGRLVPVNAQLWMNVWAATARPVEIQPNHYRWKALRDRWMPILRRVPAQQLRSDPETIADNLALEAELRDVSLRNLRRRPGVYAVNVARSFTTFNLHINSVLLKVFQHLQTPGTVLKDWYWPGDPQILYPPHASRAFAGLVAVLTALGAAGLALAARERDANLLAPAAVYASLLLAHSITWMDLMYYYVKVPFLLAFAFFFVDRAHRWEWPFAGRRLSVGALVNVLLLGAGLALSAWVL